MIAQEKASPTSSIIVAMSVVFWMQGIAYAVQTDQGFWKTLAAVILPPVGWVYAAIYWMFT